MVVLGAVLLVVALIVVLFVVLAGLPVDDGSRVTLELLGVAVETSAAVVFLMGAVALAVGELGLLATRAGLRSVARRRAEMQRLRRVEAEVQARQAAHGQRNAQDFAEGTGGGDRPPVPVTPPAPPFARRDQAGGSTASPPQEAVEGRPADRSAVDRDEAARTGPAPDAASTDPAEFREQGPDDAAPPAPPPPTSGR